MTISKIARYRMNIVWFYHFEENLIWWYQIPFSILAHLSALSKNRGFYWWFHFVTDDLHFALLPENNRSNLWWFFLRFYCQLILESGKNSPFLLFQKSFADFRECNLWLERSGWWWFSDDHFYWEDIRSHCLWWNLIWWNLSFPQLFQRWILRQHRHPVYWQYLW